MNDPSAADSENTSDKTPNKATGLTMSRYEKYSWGVIIVLGLFFIALISTDRYRKTASYRKAFTVPRWTLSPEEEYRSYDKISPKDNIVLTVGRAEFVKLADLCGRDPARALPLVRDALNAGDPNTVITAGALSQYLIGSGLTPDDLHPLAEIAQPDKDDMLALEKGALSRAATDRLMINQIAVNLLERMILVEKSDHDGHLVGWDVMDSPKGGKETVKREPVRGKWITRTGIDSRYRGTVRFDNLAVQARYYEENLDKLILNSDSKRDAVPAPGERIRSVPYFILPKSATESLIAPPAKSAPPIPNRFS